MTEYDKEFSEEEYLKVTHNMELHRRAVGLKPEITELEKKQKRIDAYHICFYFMFLGGLLSELCRRVF